MKLMLNAKLVGPFFDGKHTTFELFSSLLTTERTMSFAIPYFVLRKKERLAITNNVLFILEASLNFLSPDLNQLRLRCSKHTLKIT